ncbi:MAG: DUF4114 domain-containing protein [Bacteroidota bacterium]
MKNISYSPLFYLFLAVIFIATSCQKDVAFEPEEEVDPPAPETITFLEENVEADARMVLVNEAIVLGDTSLGRDDCEKYAAWSRIAEVTTLQLGNNRLSTTHVAMQGDLALVSYHLRGATHYGAVEVIDLIDPTKPKIKSQAFFSQADINSIEVESNPSDNTIKIWVAMSDKKDGAVLGELKIKNKRFQNYFKKVKLAYELPGGTIASNANDIKEVGEYLYVTAGRSNGGVFCINKEDLSVIGFKQFPNAKGVASDGVTVAAIQTQGTPSVHMETVGATSFSSTFPIDAISHQNVEDHKGGKTTAVFSGDYLMLTTGLNGVKGYDINSGQQVYATPEKMIAYGNANGLTTDDQYLYVACGADGLAIFPLTQNGIPDDASAFVWDLDEPEASANYVASSDGWIFIAKGEGGFKILKTPTPGDCLPVCGFDNNGVPSCLSNNVTLCSSLSARIDAALPLGAEAQALHPEYFSAGINEIQLKEDATLKLTFVEENTSLENSLGYYFYHPDCPPSSVDELTGMLVFPNFSAQGSGGNMTPGQTVTLPGKFKAGTHIGFFLMRNGWNGGHQLYYSNQLFNSNQNRQGLLFYDNECGDIIGAFQGNPTPSNDADFRDMVFKVTPSSQSAINDREYQSL